MRMTEAVHTYNDNVTGKHVAQLDKSCNITNA